MRHHQVTGSCRGRGKKIVGLKFDFGSEFEQLAFQFVWLF
jgi:hypothetical protein